MSVDRAAVAARTVFRCVCEKQLRSLSGVTTRFWRSGREWIAARFCEDKTLIAAISCNDQVLFKGG